MTSKINEIFDCQYLNFDFVDSSNYVLRNDIFDLFKELISVSLYNKDNLIDFIYFRFDDLKSEIDKRQYSYSGLSFKI